MKFDLKKEAKKYRHGKIAIVANGPSAFKRTYDEEGREKVSVLDTSQIDIPIWTMNGNWAYHKTALGFQMHSILDYEKHSKQIRQEEDHEWHMNLHKNPEMPVLTCYETVEYPHLTAYPLMEVTQYHKATYFVETISYMIALALMFGVKQIQFYGTDYTDHHEFPDERAGNEFWLGIAHARGVQTQFTAESNLLKTREHHGPEGSIQFEPGFYGYHKGTIGTK